VTRPSDNGEIRRPCARRDGRRSLGRRNVQAIHSRPVWRIILAKFWDGSRVTAYTG